MENLNELGLTLPWVIGLVILTASQLILNRSSRSAQERHLTREVQLMEARIRRSIELERNQFEARFQSLCCEQKGTLEQLQASLAEKELRSQWRLEFPQSGTGSRLEKRHQVLALAQMGMDSRDISRKLRLSQGETELLLGLREGLALAGAQRG
jgi:hypothetical protein